MLKTGALSLQNQQQYPGWSLSGLIKLAPLTDRLGVEFDSLDKCQHCSASHGYDVLQYRHGGMDKVIIWSYLIPNYLLCFTMFQLSHIIPYYPYLCFVLIRYVPKKQSLLIVWRENKILRDGTVAKSSLRGDGRRQCVEVCGAGLTVRRSCGPWSIISFLRSAEACLDLFFFVFVLRLSQSRLFGGSNFSLRRRSSRTTQLQRRPGSLQTTQTGSSRNFSGPFPMLELCSEG